MNKLPPFTKADSGLLVAFKENGILRVGRIHWHEKDGYHEAGMWITYELPENIPVGTVITPAKWGHNTIERAAGKPWAHIEQPKYDTGIPCTNADGKAFEGILKDMTKAPMACYNRFGGAQVNHRFSNTDQWNAAFKDANTEAEMMSRMMRAMQTIRDVQLCKVCSHGFKFGTAMNAGWTCFTSGLRSRESYGIIKPDMRKTTK